MPAIAQACAPVPAMSGMPTRHARLPPSPALGADPAALDDFRSVLGDASREATAAAADTDGPGPLPDEAAAAADSLLPGDAALSVQDPAILSGIHVLMHATASARPLNLPGIDEASGHRAAADQHYVPPDVALLQSQPSPARVPADAAPPSPQGMQDGRPVGEAGTHTPPAVEGSTAQTMAAAAHAMAAASHTMAAASPAIATASQTMVSALARAGTVRATADRPAAASPREPDIAPAELSVNDVRSAADASAALANAVLQGLRPPTARQTAAAGVQPAPVEALAPAPHGIDLAQQIDAARRMGLADDSSNAMPRPAEHEAGSIQEALAWPGRGESDRAGERTHGDDAVPQVIAPNAASHGAPAARAGSVPTADVRPGQIQPERVLDIPQHPASMQWREQFVDRVRFLVGDRTQTAELRLHPAELGPVSIQISISDQQASIVFLAAHEDTRRHITEALPQLRDMLGESGVRLGNASVDDHPQPNPQSGQPDARGRQPPADATEDAPVRSAAGNLNRHLIDTYA